MAKRNHKNNGKTKTKKKKAPAEVQEAPKTWVQKLAFEPVDDDNEDDGSTAISDDDEELHGTTAAIATSTVDENSDESNLKDAATEVDEEEMEEPSDGAMPATTTASVASRHQGRRTMTPSSLSTPPPILLQQLLQAARQQQQPQPTLSIISWNVLAEAYCSRRSQTHLPDVYQQVVFHRKKRKRLLLQILEQILVNKLTVDVLCLQEVDLPEIGKLLHSLGYRGVETPRFRNGGRSESCVLYARRLTWKIESFEIVQFDDLATLCSDEDAAPPTTTSASTLQGFQQSFLRRNVGIVARLQYATTPNVSVVIATAHLYWHPAHDHVKLSQAHYLLTKASKRRYPGEPLIMCGDFNATPNGITHSYLTRGHINAKRVAPWYNVDTGPPASKEETKADTLSSLEEKKEGGGEDLMQLEQQVVVEQMTTTKDLQQDHDTAHADADDKMDIVDVMASLTVDARDKGATDAVEEHPNADDEPHQVRYLLDATLNKLCRWLRILGIDTALETLEQEQERTSQNNDMRILLQRCRQERRTLVTTSTRLLQRKECPPGTYLINPTLLPNLEVALVHLLYSHGVVLDPKTFLTRCVVCNGNILPVHEPALKRQIYQAPNEFNDNMEIYQCNQCKQGYWWCDRPTSSASRVKQSATRLFQLCLRARVQVVPEAVGPSTRAFAMLSGNTPPPVMSDDYEYSAFDSSVNIAEEQKYDGWDDESTRALLRSGSSNNKQQTDKMVQLLSDLLAQKLQVLDWLSHEELNSPVGALKSVYSKQSSEHDEELLPFTNVTNDFVNTLDYILYTNNSDNGETPTSNLSNGASFGCRLHPVGRLYVPTSFDELNPASEERLHNGHLLPSNIWPSDHLAVGCQFEMQEKDENEADMEKPAEEPQKQQKDSHVNRPPPRVVMTNAMLTQFSYCMPLGSPTDETRALAADQSSSAAIRSAPIPAAASISHPQPQGPYAAASEARNAFAGEPASIPSPPQQVPDAATASNRGHERACRCGCVPDGIAPSLFEMAELRKQARLKKKLQQQREQARQQQQWWPS